MTPLQLIGEERITIGLVPRVLKHARACACYSTLVVPEWKSAVFWPLVHDAHGFRPFLVGAMWLPRGETLMVPGKRSSVLFKDNVPNTEVLALRVDFSQDRCV